VKEVLTRRELFKEMVSKDAIKKVAGAWYGFSKPLTKTAPQPEKKESLFEKVQRLNTKEKNFIPNGKEG
jgi:hypothetical protein